MNNKLIKKQLKDIFYPYEHCVKFTLYTDVRILRIEYYRRPTKKTFLEFLGLSKNIYIGGTNYQFIYDFNNDKNSFRLCVKHDDSWVDNIIKQYYCY